MTTPHTDHLPRTSEHIASRLRKLGYMIESTLDGPFRSVIHLAKTCSRTAPLPVVIKEIDVSPMAKSSARALALDEAELLSDATHPHIVSLYDQLEFGGRVFLVMQRALGGDLHDHITQAPGGRLSLAESKRIFAQLILALDYLHKRHIVHVDIKPDNIFLDENHNVVLGDFGLSQRFEPRGGCGIEARYGTLYYSAPEALLGGRVFGPELDVWSAGAVLYVMLRGRYPFWGPSDDATVASICSDEPQWPAWFTPDAIDLLSRMMCKNASRRISISKVKRHPFIKDEIRKLSLNCCTQPEDDALFGPAGALD